jgi:hypothetical protein
MKYRTTLHRQIRTGQRWRRNGFKRITDLDFSNYFWDFVEFIRTGVKR